MKFVGYVRVSKEDQVRSGLGLEAQREMLEVYVGRSPLKAQLIIEEEDEAVGGATPIAERAAFQRALALLEPGDVFLVPRLDRLTRDDGVSVDSRRAVEARGARIASTRGEGTEDDEPESVLMRLIFQAFAMFERLQTKKRTRAALAAKRSRGEPLGPPPFGWRHLRKKLVPIAGEQAIILSIAEMRAAGLPPARIADALNERGVPSKRARRWSAAAVDGVLNGQIKRKSLLLNEKKSKGTADKP